MGFQIHIGVLAFPFGTHTPPLLSLVQRLAASAPKALFTFFSTAVSNTALFNDGISSPYDNIRAYNVWDGTPDGRVFSGSLFEAVRLFFEASPSNFEKVIEEAEDENGLKICCLMSDAFLWFACDIAGLLGLFSLYSLLTCVHGCNRESIWINRFDEMLLHAGKEKQEQTLSFIPGLEAATSADLPPEIFSDNNPFPLAIALNNMVKKLPKSAAVVVNFFEEASPIITTDLRSKFKHLLHVGPLFMASPPPPLQNDDAECLSWLDSHKTPRSVIYISFGSVATPPENELAELAEALEIRRSPFLWSIKTLPHGFADRARFGKFVAWAPQRRVLMHESVGVFVSHGGWNSIMESIDGGVPLICRPFFGDHMLNSRTVQDTWKIGVKVNGGVFTKSGMVECLREVMETELGARIRGNLSVLKEKAAAAVGAGGSSSANFDKLLEVIGATTG